jgi:hypothetical protein
MNKELIYLGPGPAEEDLAQTVERDFARRNTLEVLAYMLAIRRVCGEPPEGADLRIQENRHGSFGVVYQEVVVDYDPRIPEATDYALKLEAEAPATWAEAGMKPPTQAIRTRR